MSIRFVQIVDCNRQCWYNFCRIESTQIGKYYLIAADDIETGGVNKVPLLKDEICIKTQWLWK